MINVAIVGTGNISPMHIKGYLEFPEICRIVALVDIYPEKAHAKNKEFDLNADVYDSHRLIMERDDIDLVSICTPPYTHAEIAIDMLNSGKHVLVEKTMASSLEECDKMLKAAKESGKTLAVIAQNRFRTTIMSLKNILDKQLIGRINYAQIDSLWWRGHSYYDLWWRGCWDKEGGGCTLNHAVHHIDMMCWMMGLPDKVTSVLGNVAHDNAEVEDISIAILQYANGALGQITSSVIHHGEEQRLLFQGEKAGISVPFKVFASVEQSNGFPNKNEELEKEIQHTFEGFPALPYEGHTAQIKDVLDSIIYNTSPLIQGKDGRKTIELITAIYKAGFTESAVQLPIKPDDPWYTVDGILKNVRHFHEKTSSVENFDNENITLGSSY